METYYKCAVSTSSLLFAFFCSSSGGVLCKNRGPSSIINTAPIGDVIKIDITAIITTALAIISDSSSFKLLAISNATGPNAAYKNNNSAANSIICSVLTYLLAQLLSVSNISPQTYSLLNLNYCIVLNQKKQTFATEIQHYLQICVFNGSHLFTSKGTNMTRVPQSTVDNSKILKSTSIPIRPKEIGSKNFHKSTKFNLTGFYK